MRPHAAAARREQPLRRSAALPGGSGHPAAPRSLGGAHRRTIRQPRLMRGPPPTATLQRRLQWGGVGRPRKTPAAHAPQTRGGRQGRPLPTAPVARRTERGDAAPPRDKGPDAEGGAGAEHAVPLGHVGVVQRGEHCGPRHPRDAVQRGRLEAGGHGDALKWAGAARSAWEVGAGHGADRFQAIPRPQTRPRAALASLVPWGRPRLRPLVALRWAA